MSRRRTRNVTRREFLQTAGAAAAGLAAAEMFSGCNNMSAGGGSVALSDSGGLTLVTDPTDPVASAAPTQWAIEQVREAAAARKMPLRVVHSVGEAGAGSQVIQVAGSKTAAARDSLARSGIKLPETSEALAFSAGKGGAASLMTAPDALGLVYGLTDVADRLRLSSQATLPAEGVEVPANSIRSVIRLFVSDVEDKPWFYDREFWQRYLTMLVSQRFNRFNLSLGLSYDFSTNLTDVYFFFAYPFLLNVPGFDVRAVGRDGKAVPAEEQKRNLEMIRFVSDQCALRGLQFNLGIWTHSYRWTSSPNATYVIEGLTPQTQAPYSRDAMHAVLEACPNITGITLRTHGESGVPEGSYDIWKTIFSGITGHKNADGTARVIELDLHAKTMTQEMIDTAFTTGQPVTLSCKFWAEHWGLPYIQASIREQEMPKGRDATGLMALSSGTRSFLRYGVGDLLAKGRKYKVITRVWPGTQRLLLWGDPLYAAGYGRCSSFCGMEGVEYFDPLSFKGRAGSGLAPAVAGAGRSGYKDATILAAGGDWEKYTYQYRLLGRLSYNPDAAAETWQRQLAQDFGPAAPHMEAALANSGRILPLVTTAHDPTAANFNYWPEIYVNMSLFDTARVGSYGEAPSPKIFGNVTSLDPQLFASVAEYVEAQLAGKPLGKITPAQVAGQLQAWSDAAAKALSQAKATAKDPEHGDFRRAHIDATIAAGMGQFFANKLRAAMLFTIFDRTGHEPAREQALKAYAIAGQTWETMVRVSNTVYVADLTFGPARQLRRNWQDRLSDINVDIAGIQGRSAQRHGDFGEDRVEAAIAAVNAAPKPSPVRANHTPPVGFKQGEAVKLELEIPQQKGLAAVRLMYRRVNQGERYQAVAMQAGDTYSATIPAEYTNTPFSLEYYFEIGAGQTTLVPGFGKDFTGQPYYVIQPA